MGQGGAYSNGEIGYNKENVEAIREEINNKARATGEKIIQQLSDWIIDPVSTAWYSEVAKAYFEKFRDDLKNKGEDISEIFETFNKEIQGAGADWAAVTGGEAPEYAEIEKINLDLNISKIMETDDNGSRFIQEGLKDTIVQNVEEARQSIQRFISDITMEADVSLAFLGGGQAEAINRASSALAGQVNTILDYLVIGDESLVATMERYSNQYVATAEDVTSRFTNSNFSDIQ